uniref:Uncharacterized protein n=1 Tax=Anguilla anguilla TaxID=7936 RepID=A0A0E9TEG1_ANGAN
MYSKQIIYYISNRDFLKKTCSLEIGAQKDWIKSFER